VKNYVSTIRNFHFHFFCHDSFRVRKIYRSSIGEEENSEIYRLNFVKWEFRQPTHNMVMQYRQESMWECKCADIKQRGKNIFKSQPFKCNKSIFFPLLDSNKKNFLNKMQNWFLIDLFDVYIERDYWTKCWVKRAQIGSWRAKSY
jgi:hypothetical protein